jgi:WD40-like Beta Propeller Repeat
VLKISLVTTVTSRSTPNTKRVVFVSALAVVGLAVVLSAADAESAFPGANGKIAYSCFVPQTRSAEICVVDPDGSDRGFITNTGLASDVLHEVTPAWSPNGDRLVFVRGTDDTVDPGFGPFGFVFVLRANRTGLKLISSPNFPENDPAWYPDGQKLLFGSPLKIGAADGSSLGVFGRDRGQPPTQGRGWVVSPDGRRIAFNYNENVSVMNSDGTGYRELVFGGCCASRPDWSPDGTRLIFVRNRLPDDRSFDIWVKEVDAPTPAVRLVQTDDVDEASPVWSPDGRSIAYSARRKGDSVSRIHVMAADGSAQRTITGGPLDFFPDWQPCSGRCAEVRAMREVLPPPRPAVTLVPSRRSVSYPGIVTMTGRISWDQGHSVSIQAKTCKLGSPSTSRVEAQEGGTFSTTLSVLQNTTFVANWNSQQGNPEALGGGVTSRPVRVGVRPRILLSYLGSNRYSVGVVASVPLGGRRVVLEQKRGRRWLPLRRARLGRRGTGPIPHSILSAAVLRAEVLRGVRLRASLPASQAAPCYLASRSRAIRAA